MASKLLLTEVISLPDAGETLLVQRARVKVTRGPDKGRTAVMSGGRLLIGSGDDCELVLSDVAASL